jgi:hypothetical protein
MVALLGISNMMLALIALGFALYVTQDKWRGKLGL